MSKITLEGTVKGDAVVVRRATLEVSDSGGDAKARKDLQQTFSMVVDDPVSGEKEITVEPLDTVAVLPLEEKRGLWDELSSLPIAVLFEAPAPDVSVKLAYGEVRGGDRVVVRCFVTETDREGGTYRGGASSRPSAVRATHIGIGKGARAAIAAIEDKEAPPPPPTKRNIGGAVSLALVLIGIACALVGALTISDLAYELDWVVFGTGLALTGVVFHRRATEPVVVFDERRDQWKLSWLVGVFVTCSIVFLMPASDHPSNVHDGHRTYFGTIAFGAWALWCATMFVFLVQWERVELRNARRLLLTKRHASPPVDGEWGLSEGVVEGGTLSVGPMGVACASLFEEEWREGSTPNERIFRSQNAPFTLARDDGTTLEVDPKGGLVLSAYRVQGDQVATKVHPKVLRSAHVVPNGVRAWVLGRVKLGARPRLAASVGKESLVIFSAMNPGAVLRQRLLSGAFVLSALAVFCVVLAIVVAWHPFLPDVYSPGD